MPCPWPFSSLHIQAFQMLKQMRLNILVACHVVFVLTCLVTNLRSQPTHQRICYLRRLMSFHHPKRLFSSVNFNCYSRSISICTKTQEYATPAHTLKLVVCVAYGVSAPINPVKGTNSCYASNNMFLLY